MAGRQVIDTLVMEGSIKSDRGAIIINGTRVPAADLGVLLLGAAATISGGALSILAKYDVLVLNCDWRGVPASVVYPWGSNTRIAARHIAQAELSKPRRKQAWKQIVRAKILGQQRNLAWAGSAAALRLERLRAEVVSGDSSNCEAQAARVYWEHVFSEHFYRIPGGEDRVNALLNYGYTVLRGFVIQAIAAAGLWPTYGLWHRNRSNSFCLADDLIEPFRPAVDHLVQRMSEDDDLSNPATKQALVKIISDPMGESGLTVASSIREFTSDLAVYIESEGTTLRVPAWSPDVRGL